MRCERSPGDFIRAGRAIRSGDAPGPSALTAVVVGGVLVVLPGVFVSRRWSP